MKIGFVGFGNMASAMADGWIAAGVAASDMCACAGRYDALVERCEARGMVACHDAAEVVAASDIVVAAVKPYMIEKVFAPLKDALAKKVVLSVAWTWDSAKWEQVLPGVAHISTVPNTPVSVGEGVIACEKASTLSDEQSAVVLDLLGKLGAVVELDTSLLFVGGTVGGCAPAFVAMAIEALGDAAVKHGIPRADAYRIVSQMVLGTAKLQLATGQHPAAMKDAVCSPGGATIKGVVALEDAGMPYEVFSEVEANPSVNTVEKIRTQYLETGCSGFVALGGGIGAALRYLLTELANLHGGLFFPYGTILANLIGSFCIGILFVFFSESSDLSPIVKLFFVTGILGGFTTFSTYNMELLTFVRTGAVFPALAYFSFNVIGGFVCCWLGFATGNALWG